MPEFMTAEHNKRHPHRDDRVVDAELPRRLRAERERRSVSVRELARRLNVSPSAISQIETGRVRPSVSTLYAITAELGLSLDELFGVTSHAGSLVDASPDDRTKPRKPALLASERAVVTLETGVRWESLTPDPDPLVDFLYVHYPAGSSSSPNGGLMRHAGQEYGVVLTGQLEVTVGFEQHLLGPGDSIHFDSTIPHLLRNVGDEPVTGVWMVIGRNGGHPSTREGSHS